MDAGMAERLAASMDPKALSSLQNRNDDPAVARAVAAQFGSFLMQGMMQDGDGTALSMAGGTGGAAVNAMFASAMSRYAMSGDKLGLADMIYRSTAGKTQAAAPPPAGAASSVPAGGVAPGADATAPAHGSGISLTPYRLGHGHRPLGPPIGRMNSPTGLAAVAEAAGAHSQDAKIGHRSGIASLAASTPAPSHVSFPPAAPATAATQSTPATAASAATSAPAPSEDHSLWSWLGLPGLLHFIFPSSATAAPPHAPAPQPRIAAPNTTLPGATAAPGAAGNPGAVPYGLPWTHPRTGPEAGAPDPHRAASVMGAGGTASAATDAEGFAQNLAPAIEQAAQRLGVSPRVLLAQAALETGWGHAVVGNNIFGIKAGASWSGATVAASTHEMEGGRLVAHRDTFRSYDNVGAAVDDYVSLVSASNRYRSALGAGDDATAYARGLTAGGYATDRDYAAKLTAVANSPTMSDAVAALDQDEPGQLVSAHG